LKRTALFAAASFLSLSPVPAVSQTPPQAAEAAAVPSDDPFLWLEETRGERALAWVGAENDRVDQTLARDPRFAQLQAEALTILDAQDRIPSVSFTPNGLVNFWQDAANPRGLVRATTLDSYRTENPAWQTILDIDALAKVEKREWVYKGMTCLPPARTHCMVALSDGGKDATELREFDMTTRSFVKGGFVLPESQGGVQWVDRDTLLVSRDFGDGTITESLYPFTTREWRRGTAIADAPEIYRGDAKDVSSGASLLRDAAGTIHGRVARRGVSFFESETHIWRNGAWTKLDIPLKASLGGIVDGRVLFSTDVEWVDGDQTFPADSIVSADLEAFKADPNGAPKTLVWNPKPARPGAAMRSPPMRSTSACSTTCAVALFGSITRKANGRQIRLPCPRTRRSASLRPTTKAAR